MNTPLQLLLVEDSESDAELVARALEKAGFDLSWKRVETAVDLRLALSEQTWDVVVSDYRMPQFSAPAALAIVQETGVDLPFIVVSGTIGEDAAVKMMKSGAHDYLMKNHLARLGPAVERELREAEIRRCALHDSLRRKRAEEALLESSVLNEQIISSANEGIIVCDLSGKQIVWNRRMEELSGYAACEALGKRPLDLFPFLGSTGVPQALARTLAGEAVLPIEYPVQREDSGKTGYSSSSFSPLSDAEGKTIGAIIIVRDITEHRLLMDQLHQAQKMEAVGQLAGGVAHDFNNLLQVIEGFTAMAVMDLDEESEACHNLQEASEACVRAKALVRQLLTFSRSEAMHRRRVDLNEIVTGAAKMLGRTIGEHVELEMVPSPAPQFVDADPGKIEQILMNLCINARDALPQGGKIRVAISAAHLDAAFCRKNPWAAEGDHVCLSVADNGVGMPAQVLDHIFEPFFTTKPVGKGTGLGLATVYGIVKQHEGLINVASQPDLGTAFSIYLPAARTTGEQTTAVSAGMAVGGVGTILVAEDDELVLKYTTRVLTNAGYRVRTARDGEEAIRLLEDQGGAIALALLDVIMPRMSGKAAADRMKRIQPELPILFLTGHDFHLLEVDLLPDTTTEVLCKPFQPDQLLGKISAMIKEPLKKAG
jgi:two-component system, cell cycle sensor histidine kinase and response regulator CckA